MFKGIYINDSIHGLIRLSEFEKQIISSVGFNRLHDVYQNSTVYLTYPSNRTKRFEHSIGTMKLCSDMFFYSIENSSEENIDIFYSLFEKELDKIIKDIKKKISEYDFLKQTPKAIPEIEMDSFRLSLTPRKVKNEKQYIHMVLIESVRVAALLHDIGHPPFSHVVERAMKTAYYSSKNKKSSSWNQYKSKMKEYFGENKRALHEVMGDEIAKNILKEIARETSQEDGGKESLFRVLVLECVLKMYNEGSSKAFNSLHRLIDGSVDGDRLDYVTRDPINSGINNGFIDYSRIILDMQMIMDKDTNLPLFCIPAKAINAVEDFLKRRYDLYKKIILHHRVIKTDYLLEHSVSNLIDVYMEKQESIDSSEDDFIPFDISGLWYPLGQATIEEKGNELSQWNDSWLMTVLKKIYFREYYLKNDLSQNRDELIKRQLGELLRHEKNYFSLVKRSEDFQIIDEAIKDCLRSNSKNVLSLAQELDNNSNKENNKIEEKADLPEATIIDIKGTQSIVDTLFNDVVQRDGKGFVLSYIKNKLDFLGLDKFEDKIASIVRDTCKEKYPDTKDTITVFKEISVGIDKYPILFFDTNQQIYALDDLSGVATSLRRENDFRPVFYIYTFAGDNKNIYNFKTDILKAIGDKIGEYILDNICEMFNVLNNQISEGI